MRRDQRLGYRFGDVLVGYDRRLDAARSQRPRRRWADRRGTQLLGPAPASGVLQGLPEAGHSVGARENDPIEVPQLPHGAPQRLAINWVLDTDRREVDRLGA